MFRTINVKTNSKKLLIPIIHLNLILLLIFFRHIILYLLVPNTLFNFSIIEKPQFEQGTLEVKSNKIFMPSNQIKIVSRKRLDHELEYSKANPISVVTDKDGAGYIPWNGQGEFSGRKDTHLIEIHDVILTTEIVIIKENGYHLFKRECHPRYWGWTNQHYYDPKITFNKYDVVTCIGHQHTTDFGHWFLEVLPAFATLPPEIISVTYVALPIARPFVIEGLEFFGYSRERIIEGINIPLYAKKLYTVESSWCGDLNWFLITKMRKIMIERLNLNKKPPHRFVLYNRVNHSREIENWEELKSQINTKWPQFTWEEVNLPNTMPEQLRYFNEIKFIFTIHGSILANEIAMQDNTVIIEVQMEQWLLSFIWLGLMTGKNVVQGRDNRIKWMVKQKTKVNINYMLNLIETGLKKGNYI